MFKAPDIGIDIGNSKISLCVKGEGIVSSEASYLAWRGRRPTEKSLVAFGNEAKAMFEKSSGDIQVASPMKDGVVIDCQAAGLLLRLMTRQAGIKPRLVKPRVLTGTLFGASPLERKAFIDAAGALHFRTPYLVEEPLAAAIGSGMDITASDANMLIDIGDGATEAIIVAQRKIVSGGSVRIGGATIDQSLISHMKNQHKLRISVSQARKLKQELTAPDAPVHTFVKGTGLQSLLPEERKIELRGLEPLIDRFADRTANFVLSLLSSVAPEVSADLIRNGLYICGGTSQITPVREKIARASGLDVHSVVRPENTVIDGIGRMLTYVDHFAS